MTNTCEMSCKVLELFLGSETIDITYGIYAVKV